MATTLKPISELAVGIRTSAGAAAASGKARFYAPGTLSATVLVYTDDSASTSATMPVTLDAGGRATIYALEPVRMIVKDSTETTTYYDGIVNLNRHDSIYVTATGINSGNETTLESVLATAVTSFGAGFQYKESTGATARNYVDVLGERLVSVKDFGATGDGSTDDTTAVQAAITRVKARGGGYVYLPKGTYFISAALTVDTAGVSIIGAGRGIAIIKNSTISGNGITVNLGSATDCKLVLRDFSITHSTTSSGSAIAVTNGDRIRIENVGVALHRTGINCSAVSDAVLQECIVESTDANAAAVGVSLSTRARISDCDIIDTSAGLGTGILMAGVDSRADRCRVVLFGTGISVTGARSKVRECSSTAITTGVSLTGAQSSVKDSYITAATTGVSLGAAQTMAIENTVTSCTTGVSLGAFAGCAIRENTFSSNTADTAVNASATNVIFHGNSGATLADSSTSHLTWAFMDATSATGTTATDAITPLANCINCYGSTHTAGTVTLTVNATATTNLRTGDLIMFSFYKTGANNMNVSWNAQFTDVDGSTLADVTQNSVSTATGKSWLFRWTGSAWRLVYITFAFSL